MGDTYFISGLTTKRAEVSVSRRLAMVPEWGTPTKSCGIRLDSRTLLWQLWRLIGPKTKRPEGANFGP